MPAPERFLCPRCGKASSNPGDIQESFCGYCKQWGFDPLVEHQTFIERDYFDKGRGVQVVVYACTCGVTNLRGGQEMQLHLRLGEIIQLRHLAWLDLGVMDAAKSLLELVNTDDLPPSTKYAIDQLKEALRDRNRAFVRRHYDPYTLKQNQDPLAPITGGIPEVDS